MFTGNFTGMEKWKSGLHLTLQKSLLGIAGADCQTQTFMSSKPELRVRKCVRASACVHVRVCASLPWKCEWTES